MLYYNEFENREVNVRVEYESTPIRHLAVQCPACEKWFASNDIALDQPSYEYELADTRCRCPVCEYEFRIAERNEEHLMGKDVYKDIYTEKREWVQE